jgi:predicted dehydrogenase
LGTSLVAGGLVGLSPRSLLAASANEQLNLGLIGCGDRGGNLLEYFSHTTGTHVAGLCDPDRERLAKFAKQHPDAQTSTDLRDLLDNPEIDAVLIATCNHWHCLAAIWAMQAGKHVYVEKPLGHYSWDGVQTVKAARHYDKVCQVGTQQRSDPMQSEIKQFLHDESALGPLKWVRVNRFGVRANIGRRAKPMRVPDSIDYNMWVGPAADQPILRKSLHYDWHWDWNTGSGEMGNWGVHLLDDVRNNVFQDRIAFPSRITAAGGRYGWNDAGDTPNVMFAIAQVGEIPVATCLTNLPDQPGGETPPPCPGPASGYIAYCEGGRFEGQRGSAQAFDADGKLIRRFRGDSGNIRHQQNFVDAVRAGDSSGLLAPVEVGHHSTQWCNLANLAHRVRAESGATSDDEAISHVFGQTCHAEQLLSELRKHLAHHEPDAEFVVGPVLEFDGPQERFTGKLAEQANALLKRHDRAGFEIPEIA